MHLLGRMLAFDPGRRISAEEALCHEYFAALEASAVSEMGNAPCCASLRLLCAASLHMASTRDMASRSAEAHDASYLG